MYDFIYYYFYKLVLKRNPDAKFIAAGLVWFTLVVHIFFPLSIIKKVFDLDYSSYGFSDSYVINKLYMMPIAIILMFATHFYYKKRFDEIENKYLGDEMLTRKNTIIVFSIILIPLIIMIQLLKK
jgi:hypothetical protein